MHSEDKSPFTLLKETGYFELHDQVSVSDIREALTRGSGMCSGMDAIR